MSRRRPHIIARHLGLGLVALGAAAFSLLSNPCEAPAGLEEMYRDFPKPDRDCDDPLTGSWVGHAIYNDDRYRLIMEVARDPEDSTLLVGSLDSHYWEADFDQPPPCNDDHYQTIIHMPSLGVATPDNKAMTMAGQSWERKKHICGEPHSYILDAVVGTLEADEVIKAEWFAVPEGGLRTREEITTTAGSQFIVKIEFRRTQCGERDKPAIPDLKEVKQRQPEASRCGCF